MGEETELPPVESHEGERDVQAESISLDEAIDDPVVFVEHTMEIPEAEEIQMALIEVVQVTPEGDTSDLSDPPIKSPEMNPLSAPDTDSISSLLPSDQPGALIITETSQPLEQQSSVPDVEDVGIAANDLGTGVSAAGDSEGPNTEGSNLGIPPSDPISNVSQVQGPRSAEAQGLVQEGELEIYEDEVAFTGSGINAASDVMDRGVDVYDEHGGIEGQEVIRSSDEKATAAGGVAVEGGTQEIIEREKSASGISSEDSLRDLVSESEPELGGTSKTTGHGVFSKAREIPVSVTGPGGEPAPVMGDLSALGGPKGSESEGSESEASESQEQVAMDGDPENDSGTFSSVEEGGEYSSDIASALNIGNVQYDWSEFVKDIPDGEITKDINALIQYVLRDSYLETNRDLQFHADKVRFYNELKKALRQEPNEVRDYLTTIVQGLDGQIEDGLSEFEAISNTEASPASVLEDISIIPGRDQPTGDISDHSDAKSDLEIWEENEPEKPIQGEDESDEDFEYRMAEYQRKHEAGLASRPPDGEDEDTGGTDDTDLGLNSESSSTLAGLSDTISSGSNVTDDQTGG